jgi:putative copper resistance protein D
MSTRPSVARAPAGPARGILVAAALVALVVAVPAALFTGATATLDLGDTGAVVRWGLPLVRAVHDLSMAATIGLLLMAGMIVPEAPRTSRRITATRYAAGAAAVWFVTAVVGLVLSFSDLSSVRMSDPGFLEQFKAFVWQLDILRVGAISAGVALVVAAGASFTRTRTGMTWLFFLSLLGVLPLALAGHAAGSTGHDAAVNSLAFHLVGVSLWVGGLIALLVLRPLLGKGLAVSVARYSTLAGWCFAFVALSGILNAAIRLGGFGGLWTTYGGLVIGKSVCLLLLGAAGWRQRRVVVERLRDDPLARRAFARLATVEVVIMSAAIGMATVLARSAPPVAETPPQNADAAYSLTGYYAPPQLTAARWVTTYRTEWLFTTVAVVAIGLYLAGVVRLHRRGDRWPVMRTVSWIAGWLVFLYAVDGAPGVYGHVLFSMHMTMHMIISMGAPMLLVIAAPVTLALRTLHARKDKTFGPRELVLAVVHSRYLRAVANPVVAALIFFLGLIVFYYSPLFELALRTHTGHVLMVTHFMLAGYLFAWVLIGVDPGPKRWPPSLRLLVLFATLSFHAFFGVALMTGSSLLAPDFFNALHLSWMTNPIGDQQKGGGIAWGVGELPTMLLALIVCVQWMRSEAATAKRRDRQAERDDDAELRAYNAQLAALAGRGPVTERSTTPATRPDDTVTPGGAPTTPGE